MKTIGVIGVGNMGLPMLKALRRAGFDVVARDLRPAAGAGGTGRQALPYFRAPLPATSRRAPTPASCTRT